MPAPDALPAVTSWALLFGALCVALVLVTVGRAKPKTVPLLVAGCLVAVCLLGAAILPVELPGVLGLVIALPATVLGVVGGDPVVRRILSFATHGTVREGIAGGIVVQEARGGAPAQEILRGGTTIGYLERLAVVLSIIAGFPEAVAVLVALKGVGRFSELATPAARERFIVGTLASLVWAGMVGGLVRLAIW